MKRLILLLFIILLSSNSCSSRIGKFTTISTSNVRGLEYVAKNRNSITDVSEKSCTHRLYITRVLVGFFTFGIGWFVPQFDLTFGDKEEDRMINVVDYAIAQGRGKGNLEGDLLVDATFKEELIILPLLYGYKCIKVDASLTSSVVRTKGFLEKE